MLTSKMKMIYNTDLDGLVFLKCFSIIHTALMVLTNPFNNKRIYLLLSVANSKYNVCFGWVNFIELSCDTCYGYTHLTPVVKVPAILI